MAKTTWFQGVLATKPNEWYDRSIMAFSIPCDDPMPPNVTLTRDLRNTSKDNLDDTIEVYAKQQLETLVSSLPSFNLERERTSYNGQYPAAEFLFSWESGNGRIKQWLIYLLMPDKTIVSFTSTAAASKFSDHEKAFYDFVWATKFDPKLFPPNQ